MADSDHSILLEKSPFAVDRAELIGRDPRKITPAEYADAGITAMPILEVIKAKCLDCCIGEPNEVRKCVAVSCPNWPYRMGANPFTTRILSPEERDRRAALARKMFKHDKLA